MDQMGETYKVRRKRNNDWTEVIDFDFLKVRKCEEMWSLGTDRPGTPCAVKVKKHCYLGTMYLPLFFGLQDVDGLWYRARIEKVLRVRIVRVRNSLQLSCALYL